MLGRTVSRWPAALFTLAAATAVLHELAARRYYRTSPGPERLVHDDERIAWTPLWREWLAPGQWLRLRFSPVYRGHGVPRGDGTPVVLVHGFLTRGSYLGPLRGWLERIGYDATVAGIGWNVDCFDVLADRLIAELRATRARTGRPVALIGHSLGGVLARAAAARAPELVASVAMLGAPVRGLRLHPVLKLGAVAARASVHARRRASVDRNCMTLACTCATVQALARPLPPDMPQLAVAARHDGLTDWRYAVDRAAMPVMEADTSHVGLVLDPAVYEAVRRHLARHAPAPRAETA